MRKPPELVEPDERWQLMIGDRAALVDLAATWSVAENVREEVAAMLKVARELFVHSYFVYEFSVVAATWSLFAVEAALRDRLATTAQRRTGLVALIRMAHALGWLTTDEREKLCAGAELRNSLVHASGQTAMTVGVTVPILETAHAAVSKLYAQPPVT